MRAKRSQALLLAEQCIEGTQDRSNDASGELGIPNGVAVQRDRLIFDARRWYLSKLLPKIFGEKIVHEGSADKPIELVVRVVGGSSVPSLKTSSTPRMLDASVPKEPLPEK